MVKNESKYTVIVKTCNSGETLANTLESVCSFGEIIAVDFHSTDDTPDILKEYKVKTIFTDKFDVSGSYNQTLDEAKGDWILVLEDDEIVPEELLLELENYARNPKKNRNSIAFDIKLFYLNKEIKSAKIKNVVRFFKKNACVFDEKRNFELSVKEGKIYKFSKNLRIKNKFILKYLQSDISRFVINVTEKNKNILKTQNKIAPSVVIYPCFSFIYYYFIRLGFLDGMRGFVFAKGKMIEKFILQVMLLEKQFKEKE